MGESPTQAPGSYPDQQRPFATVMLNGVQILRCALPEDIGKKVSVSGEVAADLKAALEATGMQLECMMLSPNVVPKENIQWKGLLLIDDVYEVSLGCLFTRRQTKKANEFESQRCF